jgi:hypothetical protein
MNKFTKEACANPDEALKREWLETNGLGGFASSSITGLNTRRYHGSFELAGGEATALGQRAAGKRRTRPRPSSFKRQKNYCKDFSAGATNGCEQLTQRGRKTPRRCFWLSLRRVPLWIERLPPKSLSPKPCRI